MLDGWIVESPPTHGLTPYAAIVSIGQVKPGSRGAAISGVPFCVTVF